MRRTIIMLLYRHGCLPSYVIGEMIGKKSNYVSSILVQLKKRGIVRYTGFCWELTEEGRRIAEAEEVLEKNRSDRTSAQG